MNTQYKKSIYLCLILATLLSSCKKFLTIDPPQNEVVAGSVFNNDAMAIAAMQGVYSQLANLQGFTSGDRTSITILAGLSSDEFNVYSAGMQIFENNSLIATTLEVKSSVWDAAYKVIYSSNSILAGLSTSKMISEVTKKQLEGEAKFIRAFCHFYLYNFFGDVPLALTIDYRINNVANRSTKVKVYQQIIDDLISAQSLLSDDYIISNNERVRANKSVASALLARCYLYIGDWTKAEALASSVINNTTAYNLVPDLNTAFLNNSTEALWQLLPIQSQNTKEAAVFIPSNPSIFSTGYVSLTNQVLNAFETGDNRRIKWVGSVTSISTGQVFYYPYKYKAYLPGAPVTEYYIVLRLAEQYLIRAEARAQQNNIAGAQADLNAIRNRAGLANTTANTQAGLVSAIEQERRVEFFAEWGHRWFDLKRTNRADGVLSSIKAPNWQNPDVLYPIPQADIQNNPNLTQNTGY